MTGGRYGKYEEWELIQEEKGSSRSTRPSDYIPKTQTIIFIQIKSDKIREKAELWKEKALIEKIVGI